MFAQIQTHFSLNSAKLKLLSLGRARDMSHFSNLHLGQVLKCECFNSSFFKKKKGSKEKQIGKKALNSVLQVLFFLSVISQHFFLSCSQEQQKFNRGPCFVLPQMCDRSHWKVCTGPRSLEVFAHSSLAGDHANVTILLW